MPDIPEVPSAFKDVIDDGTPKPLWSGACLSQEKLDAVMAKWAWEGNSEPYAFRYTFSFDLTPKVPEPKMMAWPTKDR